MPVRMQIRAAGRAARRIERLNEFVVWRFCDGKAGHDRQSAGLLRALEAAANIETHVLDANRCKVTPAGFIRRDLDFGTDLPAPDLLIGAGRRCQLPLLAARRARGGHSVYLMRPQWPWGWFDLCLIPSHDRPRLYENVVVTEGVLNDITPALPDAGNGLILIGGPSAHFRWDSGRLLEQIERIIAAAPAKPWVIGDSRRTPPETSARLQGLTSPQVQFTPAHESGADWVQRQLGSADTAWISADSVSMIYEALSAGVAVGVLDVPPKRADRINTLAADLFRTGRLTTYTGWTDGAVLRRGKPLDEAARCAAIIIARFGAGREPRQ